MRGGLILSQRFVGLSHPLVEPRQRRVSLDVFWLYPLGLPIGLDRLGAVTAPCVIVSQRHIAHTDPRNSLYAGAVLSFGGLIIPTCLVQSRQLNVCADKRRLSCNGLLIGPDSQLPRPYLFVFFRESCISAACVGVCFHSFSRPGQRLIALSLSPDDLGQSAVAIGGCRHGLDRLLKDAGARCQVTTDLIDLGQSNVASRVAGLYLNGALILRYRHCRIPLAAVLVAQGNQDSDRIGLHLRCLLEKLPSRCQVSQRLMHSPQLQIGVGIGRIQFNRALICRDSGVPFGSGCVESPKSDVSCWAIRFQLDRPFDLSLGRFPLPLALIGIGQRQTRRRSGQSRTCRPEDLTNLQPEFGLPGVEGAEPQPCGDYVGIGGQGSVVGLPRFVKLTVFPEQVSHRYLDRDISRLNRKAKAELSQGGLYLAVSCVEGGEPSVRAGQDFIQGKQTFQTFNRRCYP